MPYNPNANWTAAIAAIEQDPVYYVAIDGLTTVHYSTGPVKSPAVTKKEYLGLPSGGSTSQDVLNNRVTRTEIELPIYDVDGEITNLVAWTNPDNTLGTLINRKVTIYAGYRHLAESDYAPIFVGRIRGMELDESLRLYIFRVQDIFNLLDAEIMANATQAKRSYIEGNVVNIVWSMMTGTFSTVHADFPLRVVSTDTGSTSVPTGAGIAAADIDTDLLKAERDLWHPEDIVSVDFREPTNLRTELEEQFYRVFQARPIQTEAGKMGFRFRMPALPSSDSPQVKAVDHIVSIGAWRRMIELHVNKFTVHGDYDAVDGEYDTILYNTETAEDTADQTATGETRELKIESKWIRTTIAVTDPINGEEIAAELASRNRFLFLATPVEMDLELLFSRINLQVGDSIYLTDPNVPNLLSGDRGVIDGTMLVTGIEWNFEKGTIIARVLDTRYKRYGVIGPNTLVDYDSATDQERNTYCWVGRLADNKVGTALDHGYQIV